MLGDDEIELTGAELDDPKEDKGGIAAEVETDKEPEATVEPVEDAEVEDVQVIEKPESRAAKAIQELKRERNEERERAAKLQADYQQLLKEKAEAAQNGQQQQEQVRLEQMEPHERVAFLANKQAQILQNQIAALQHQVEDSKDQARFQAKVSSDPLYGKYADQVEAKLKEMQIAGVTTNRETILKYLVGEALLAKRDGQAGNKTKQAAAQRISAATGKVVSARSEPAGGKKGKTAEERLDGVFI